MSAELFVYWRTAAPLLAHAQAAVQSLQSEWRQAHPGLRACLYLRQDDGAADPTLMETYSHPAGLTPSLRQAIVGAAQGSLAPWCAGPRHVEAFSPVPEPGPATGLAPTA